MQKGKLYEYHWLIFICSHYKGQGIPLRTPYMDENIDLRNTSAKERTKENIKDLNMFTKQNMKAA